MTQQQGFLGTIGWIKGNLMANPDLKDKGYSNENFYPGAENIPNSHSFKSILPAMTSNTSPAGYEASSSGVSTGWSDEITRVSQPYLAFDKDKCSRWLSQHYNSWRTHWLQIKLPEAKQIRAYSINCVSQSGGYAENMRIPKSFNLLGSNNGSSFTLIDTQTDIPAWEITDLTHEPLVFKVKESPAYSYYRLEITEPQGHSGKEGSGYWDCHVQEFDLLS